MNEQNALRRKVKKLFKELRKQKKFEFPQKQQKLTAATKHGVYVIFKKNKVMHVGRTLRGKEGLYQRLKNHLYGSSSFTNEYLKGNGDKLRDGFTYQFLVVEDARKRALLEAYATGTLCPEYIGLGE